MVSQEKKNITLLLHRIESLLKFSFFEDTMCNHYHPFIASICLWNQTPFVGTSNRTRPGDFHWHVFLYYEWSNESILHVLVCGPARKIDKNAVKHHKIAWIFNAFPYYEQGQNEIIDETCSLSHYIFIRCQHHAYNLGTWNNWLDTREYCPKPFQKTCNRTIYLDQTWLRRCNIGRRTCQEIWKQTYINKPCTWYHQDDGILLE